MGGGRRRSVSGGRLRSCARKKPSGSSQRCGSSWPRCVLTWDVVTPGAARRNASPTWAGARGQGRDGRPGLGCGIWGCYAVIGTDIANGRPRTSCSAGRSSRRTWLSQVRARGGRMAAHVPNVAAQTLSPSAFSLPTDVPARPANTAPAAAQRHGTPRLEEGRAAKKESGEGSGRGKEDARERQREEVEKKARRKSAKAQGGAVSGDAVREDGVIVGGGEAEQRQPQIRSGSGGVRRGAEQGGSKDGRKQAADKTAAKQTIPAAQVLLLSEKDDDDDDDDEEEDAEVRGMEQVLERKLQLVSALLIQRAWRSRPPRHSPSSSSKPPPPALQP
eukprot:2011609-Rhodomonas_salina.1